MLRTLYAVSSLLLGISLLLMGLALLSTAMGLRAASEGMNDTYTGIVMAAYFAGFILGSYRCPGLIRRIGPIRTFAALAAGGAVASFLPALIVEPLVWTLLRFLIGFCVVGLYMVLESWLNGIAPNDKRGQILAVYMMATLLAHALGQYLLLLDPQAQGTAFGLAALFFSLGLIPVAITKLPEPKPVPTPALQLRHVVVLSPLAIAGALTGGLVSSSFWALGAVFAYRIGLTGGDIVNFMVATILGGAVLQWPIGRLSDHVDRRKVLLLTTLLCATAALVAAWIYPHSRFGLQATMFVFGGLMFAIYGLSVAHLNDRVHGDDALDASRSALLTYGVGAAIGPVFAGVAMSLLGPAGIFYYVATVLFAFLLLALLRLVARDAVPAEERGTFVAMTRTSSAALQLDPRLDTDLPPSRQTR